MGTSFKDQIRADISSVFLNGLEFADDHELNGKTIDVVWNGMTLTDAVMEAMECESVMMTF